MRLVEEGGGGEGGEGAEGGEGGGGGCRAEANLVKSIHDTFQHKVHFQYHHS